MSISQLFFIVASIICFWGGFIMIQKWRRHRTTDLRPFSWKRWFNTDDGLNPRENLINGLIGIAVGIMGAAIFISTL